MTVFSVRLARVYTKLAHFTFLGNSEQRDPPQQHGHSAQIELSHQPQALGFKWTQLHPLGCSGVQLIVYSKTEVLHWTPKGQPLHC